MISNKWLNAYTVSKARKLFMKVKHTDDKCLSEAVDIQTHDNKSILSSLYLYMKFITMHINEIKQMAKCIHVYCK